ncbi:hypothetical protein FRC04_012135 [Tulasnella sp. 424]|nr:hypothetical protein FRC04_012135 [Tulasnella sp. 424]KAG8971057.1 hypothetical protein FRC05_011523 [Tulasnella sp. 425]
MSPIQDIVKVAVQTYLQHYVAPEKASLLRADASFAAEPTKDLMIDVLEKFQSLVNEEITTQACFMKRRRNQEHSIIYRLPPELLVEIILATDPTSRSRSSFRSFMSVSKYWFDVIIQCPRIWSLVDLSAAPESRKMEMTRRLRGPVEVQCRSSPFDLDRSLTELAALNPTRLRSLVCILWPTTEALLSFFQERSSNIVDLAMACSTAMIPERRFDLGMDGPSLCHVDVRKVALPWASPRLSQLHTLTLQNLKKDMPSISDLHRILTSSPALRRLRLRFIGIEGQEPPEGLTPPSQPILLPELRELVFDKVPSAIPKTLIPLIRSHSCQHLEVRPWKRAPLEPNEGTLGLIIGSVVDQSKLLIRLSHAKGTPSVALTSDQLVEGDTLGDWADYITGINVELSTPPSADGPWGVFDELASRLHAAGWNPKDVHILSGANPNALGTDAVLPLLYNFISSFPTITKLHFNLPTSLGACSALRFLEGGTTGMSTPLPELTSIELYVHSTPEPVGLEDGVRSFLERRYPLHRPASADALPEVSPLARIVVPQFVVEPLGRAWPATSLSRKEVLINWIDPEPV